MRYSTDWEDYELIDCSDGYKLERWTNEILVRPDPQVIWKMCIRDSYIPNTDMGRYTFNMTELQKFVHQLKGKTE